MFLSLAAMTSRSAQAQTYTVLHTFTNEPDGTNPNPLIQDAQGNLYGTTRAGGAFGYGSVFKMDPSGKETVLHSIQGGTDGAIPLAALIRDSEGNLYGNTQGDGTFNVPTVFKIDPSGNETVLYDFTGGHGCCQDSPLAIDGAGILYGMSPYEGDYNCGYRNSSCGLLYKLTQAGENTVIHVFKGLDGIQPEGGLVVGVDGSLYGAAIHGGNLSCYTPGGGHYQIGCGTIYKLDKSGKFTVLHRFTGKADGSAPLGLIRDPEGNLYGIAEYGGNTVCIEDAYGCGTIFKVDTRGKFSVLFRFTVAIAQPAFAGHLLRDSEGNLYGVNQIGGANNSGFIFEFTPRGTFSILFSFPSTIQVQDGSDPQGITRDSAGNFYGSMLLRGSEDGNCGFEGCGTVFKITF
jgi:uncharacterized repeat protein (TIGR03803 family)